MKRSVQGFAAFAAALCLAVPSLAQEPPADQRGEIGVPFLHAAEPPYERDSRRSALLHGGSFNKGDQDSVSTGGRSLRCGSKRWVFGGAAKESF
jgi:hypothetical protein